jgi:putative SOS response-associated peptidase YedK
LKFKVDDWCQLSDRCDILSSEQVCEFERPFAENAQEPTHLCSCGMPKNDAWYNDHMCGRYTLTKPEEIPARFEISNQMPLYDASYNIPPASVNPIVVRRSPNKVELARWGLIPFWAKDPRIGYKTINARAEDIANKPSFRKPIRSQRCLVPADGFYEWKTLTLEGKPEKFPWYIGLKGRKLFAFAGVYEVANLDGHETFTYSIVTTIPNKTMENLHSRMPVILHQKDEDKWLATDSPTRCFGAPDPVQRRRDGFLSGRPCGE